MDPEPIQPGMMEDHFPVPNEIPDNANIAESDAKSIH